MLNSSLQNLNAQPLPQRLRGPIGGERVETNSNSYTQVVLVSRRWQFGIV